MELASVRIFVDDLPAAVKFYADVVGLKKIWDEPDVAIFGDKPVIVVEFDGPAWRRRELWSGVSPASPLQPTTPTSCMPS